MPKGKLSKPIERVCETCAKGFVQDTTGSRRRFCTACVPKKQAKRLAESGGQAPSPKNSDPNTWSPARKSLLMASVLEAAGSATKAAAIAGLDVTDEEAEELAAAAREQWPDFSAPGGQRLFASVAARATLAQSLLQLDRVPAATLPGAAKSIATAIEVLERAGGEAFSNEVTVVWHEDPTVEF